MSDKEYDYLLTQCCTRGLSTTGVMRMALRTLQQVESVPGGLQWLNDQLRARMPPKVEP